MLNNTTATTVENSNISMAGGSVDDSSRQPRIVFLVLFILVTLVGNICLVIVILSNKKFRGTVINLIFLNLAVVDLIDCCLNMPLVFGSLLVADWSYGNTLCQINTFLLNIVIIETVLTLTALTAERFIAVKITPSRNGIILSPSRISFILVYTWCHSFGFSLPLLSGSIPSTFRQQLHLCSISESSSLVFICLTSVVCFVVPVVVMVVLFALMFKAVYKDRVVVRSNLAEQNYSEKGSEQNQFWKEVNMAKLVCVFSCIWVVFEVPYIVTAYIKQYQYSREFKENPHIGEINYPWVVDVTFIWIRFSFSCILPILLFCWKREFWRSWKDTILCHRSNSVTDFHTSGSTQASGRDKHQNMPNIKSKEKIDSPSALTFNVPVLFATESGIHVQTDEDNVTDSELYNSEVSAMTARSPTDLKFLKGRKLDVVSALEFIPPDTSDYDSNSDTEATDQYSLSQPISTRQLDHDLDKVSRSSSQPDVQDKRNSSRTSSLHPFEPKLTTASYGTDSGLDLSGTTKCQDPEIKNSSDITTESNFRVREEARTYVKSQEQDDKSVCPDDAKSEVAQADVIPEDKKLSDNSNNILLNVTYLCSNGLNKDNLLKSESPSLVTKKPPLHLEPLSQTFVSSDGKQTKKRKTRHTKTPGNPEVVEHRRESTDRKSGGKKSSKPGHKRQGTSESEKALLGSSSSAELQDMRSEMLRIEAEKREEEEAAASTVTQEDGKCDS